MAQINSDALLQTIAPKIATFDDDTALQKKLVGDKAAISSEDVLSRLKLDNSGPSSTLPLEASGSSLGQAIMEELDQQDAANRGMGAGFAKVLAGPVQFALERVSPEMAQSFTDWVKKETATTEGTQEEKDAFEAGKGPGELAGMVGGGEVGAATKLGALATGGALAATSFQDETQTPIDRAVEGAEGVITAAIPAVVGKGLKKVIQKGAESKTIQNFVDSVQRKVGDLEPELSMIKQNIDSYFERQKQAVRDVYTSRDAQGVAAVAPKPMVQKFDVLTASLSKATVDEKAAGTIADIADRLNIPQIKKIQQSNDAVMLKHQTDLNTYNTTIADNYNQFSKYIEEANKATGSKIEPIPLADFIDASKQEGSPLPAPPARPKLTPLPATRLSDVFAALTTANADLGRGKNAAKTNQLTQVKSFLMDLVNDSNHPDPARAKAIMDRASNTYKEKILPTRKQFGYAPFDSGATRDLSEADVFKMAGKAVESGDPKKAEQFASLIGPQGKPQLARVAMYNALDKASENVGTSAERVNPTKLYQYMTKNRGSLSKLMTPEESAQMEGFAKLAGVPVQRSKGTSHTGAGNVLFLFAGERALEGDMHNALRLAGAGIATKMALKTFSALKENPASALIMKKASRYPVGSKELETLTRRLNHMTTLAGGVGGGVAAEELGDPLQ